MYLSLHTTIAVATSNYLPNPWLAFITNFILHFILDLIPHGDTKDASKLDGKKYDKTFIIISLADLLTSTAIIWYYAWTHNFAINPNVPWGILGAIIPDLAMGFAIFSELRPWLYNLNKWWTEPYLAFHKKNHFIFDWPISKITALILQAAVIILIFYFI